MRLNFGLFVQELYFCEINDEIFSGISMSYYVPVTSYYRLFCSDLLKGQDKCVFLDSDLVVNIDISELYSINIDGFYIAGSRDIHTITHPNTAYGHREYGIEDLKNYINCGVLIMNLDLMNQHNLTSIFKGEIKKKNRLVDQDVFNRVCKGKIKVFR